MKKAVLCAVTIMCACAGVFAGDWPIFKGNIYFTGNNDEITVKNANLKWLYQANEMVFNPIISDGRVYFVDLAKTLYCLDEDSGKEIWKTDLKKMSEMFGRKSVAMGKVKYPLIKGNNLIVTDSFVIYCLDKRTGVPQWARTGMRDEEKIHDPKSWKPGKSGRFDPTGRDDWDPAKTSRAIVDGIYADPVINEDLIYYGTRNMFISRDLASGRIRWKNGSIKSFSGFPSFYDTVVFTQSMDYTGGKFSLLCLDAGTGEKVWEKPLAKPSVIFSPVVYGRKVYLPSDKSIHCFNLKDGEKLWEKDYGMPITSNPSFTEKEVLFTVGNRKVVVINPENGDAVNTIELGENSSPYFVTIRDQLYVATTFKKEVGKSILSYASLKAMRFDKSGALWEFVPPFPGGGFQPAASNGIMFQPAGNYLYAVGTDYYPRIVDGGDSRFKQYGKDDGTGPDGDRDKKALDDSKDRKTDDKDRKDNGDRDKKSDDSKDKKTDDRKIDDGKKKDGDKIRDEDLRKLSIRVVDDEGNTIPSTVDIRKWDKGKLVYDKRVVIKGDAVIDVPPGDNVELTASTDGHVPNKAMIRDSDKNAEITLERIEKGKAIVVDNILFEVGEAYLTKDSLNVLDRMADSLKKNRKVKIEVRGHTDSTGPRDVNMVLSRRRADSVRDYLVKNGVSPERLSSAGFGPDKPLADNRTDDGRRKNRRTEFFILDK